MKSTNTHHNTDRSIAPIRISISGKHRVLCGLGGGASVLADQAEGVIGGAGVQEKVTLCCSYHHEHCDTSLTSSSL